MDKERMIKGVKISYLFFFLVSPVTFLIRIFLSRVLTLEEFGLFYAIIGLLSLTSLITTLGLNNGLVHFLPKLFHEKRYGLIKKSLIQVISIQILLSGVVSILLFFLRKPIADYYFHTNLAAEIIPIFAILFVFNILFDLIFTFFRGLNYELMYASANPLRLFVVFLFSIIIYLVHPHNLIYKLSLIWSLSFLVGLFYLGVAIRKYKPVFLKKFPKKDFFEKIFKYGLITLATGGAGFLLSKTDVVMLTAFWGVEEVAIYEIVIPLVTLILIFLQPLSAFLFPMISKLHHTKNKEMINNIIAATYNFGFYIILPVAVISFSFASKIIDILFGSKYATASLALQILVFGFLFKAFNNVNFVLLDGVGQIKKKMHLFYAGAIFNIILNLLLIPKFGVYGAALATSFSFLLMFFISTGLIKKLGYTLYFKNWFKIILANILILFEISLLRKVINFNHYLEICSIIAIVILTYLAIGYYFRLVNFKELFSQLRLRRLT